MLMYCYWNVTDNGVRHSAPRNYLPTGYVEPPPPNHGPPLLLTMATTVTNVGPNQKILQPLMMGTAP